MKNRVSAFVRLLVTFLAMALCLGAACAALVLPLRWLAREQERAVGVVETRDSLSTGGLDEKAAADPLARSLYEHKQKAGLQRQDSELSVAADTAALWEEWEGLYTDTLPDLRSLMGINRLSSGVLRDRYMGYEGYYAYYSGSQPWNWQDQYECTWHTDREMGKLVKLSFQGGFPAADVQAAFFRILPQQPAEIEAVYGQEDPQGQADRGGAPPKPDRQAAELIVAEGDPARLDAQMSAPETAERLMDVYMAYLGVDPADYTAVSFGPWRAETPGMTVCMRYSPTYQIYLYANVYCRLFEERGQEMAYIAFGFGACSLTEQELERAIY